MKCEMPGLMWTCSRLCPSRSGNGVRRDENAATFNETSLPSNGTGPFHRTGS